MKKTGILLPIFALPNKYGIGTMGKEAYKFIDFLKASKQDLWQILPTNPTSYGDSPYQSFSTYAQNPYFIDLEMLVEDKLLTKKDLKESYLQSKSSYIDYGNIFYNKMRLLKKAYKKSYLFKNQFVAFKRRNFWLKDYAMFMVLKEAHGNQAWNTWKDEYKYRDEKALARFYKENKEAVEAYMFMQYLYAKQWKNVLEYAHKQGIEVVGDMPIYVAYDSVEVWANKDLFLLDQWCNPCCVAGVPPDYFSATGQLWGNPIYNYPKMAEDGYAWWDKRISYSLKILDYVRIDHFRGFSAYYTVPFGAPNAINGQWVKGPGMDLFGRINEKYNNPKIIAENLGLLDDDVNQLIKDTTYPGMKILEFEVYSYEASRKLANEDPNNVLYPGTHDNNTFIGWYNENASWEDKNNLHRELNHKEGDNLINNLIKYCYSSNYNYVVFLMQDILGLGSETRYNFPGQASGNWQFRFSKGHFSKKLARKLASYKDKYAK